MYIYLTIRSNEERANFLDAIAKASCIEASLLFSTALAALFVDAGDSVATTATNTSELTTLGDLNFELSSANAEARLRFKKLLPGIINVRTQGETIFVFRRVQQSYQWESYGPINPV